VRPLRVGITGAAGHVGSALAARLKVEHGFDTVAVVRNVFAARLLADAGAEVRVGSVTDPSSSRELFAGCDAVVNCALAKGWPATSRERNEAIVRNLASASGAQVVVHFSSVAVYGPCSDPRYNSFERPQPDSAYGLEKLRLEQVAERLFARAGKQYHIVRLGHVYGPGQWVSREILERSGDASFALPFGGDISSNAVSIDAVVAAVAGMLRGEQAVGIRNLVDSPQSSWRALFDFHTGLLGRGPVASMPEGASLRLREGYYGSARHPALAFARSAIARLFTLDMIGLAKLETFRRLAHRPLRGISPAFEGWANRRYVRRKVRSALRENASGSQVSDVLCAPPIPGPCLGTIAAATAFTAMRNDLRAWLHSLADYRWDHTDLDYSQRQSGLARVA
jgi:nucleoside-diphosphate-sugar epimerase